MSRVTRWWRRRREQRQARVLYAILGCLDRGSRYYSDIAARTGWGPATIYPALALLERRGQIVSGGMERSGRRAYWIPGRPS